MNATGELKRVRLARLRAQQMLQLHKAGKTMKEVGEAFGCSKQRVQQIFARCKERGIEARTAA